MSASFLPVILISISAVAVVLQFLALPRLAEMVSPASWGRAFRLAPFFADYYQQSGSWEGVGQSADQFNEPLPPELIDGEVAYYPGRAKHIAAVGRDRMVLADSNELVIVDSRNLLFGRSAAASR